MNTSGRFRTVGALLAWCKQAPPGTRLDAHAVAEILDVVPDATPAEVEPIGLTEPELRPGASVSGPAQPRRA